MKAIGFFLTVFLSMLAVFLIATGEVKRWFVRESPPLTVLGSVRAVEGPRGAVKNIFEFPFYDFEQAALKFVIRAEFIQEELGVSSQIDKIDTLSLRNGVIEIPLGDEAPPSPAPPAVRPRKLTLEFQSAVYDRRSKDPGGKSILEVLLREGKGTTEDGTSFHFEELVFGEKGQHLYSLRSSKPVSIQSPVFAVRSPTGLDGTLDQRPHNGKPASRHELLLLPPVSALIDPESLSTLDGEAPPPGPARGQLLATTCQGPLVIVRESGNRIEGADAGPRAQIRFDRDVVVYPVARTVTLETCPAPRATRFDCQQLTVNLETSGGKILPVSAVAVSDGGRVKASFRDEAEESAETYTIDGDKLDWKRGSQHTGVPLTASKGKSPVEQALLDGEAVLSGSPVLRARGKEIRADRVVYRPAEDRAILQQVTGTVEHSAADGKDGKRAGRTTDDLLEKLGFGGASRDTARARSDRPGQDGAARPDDGAAPEPPASWDLRADEAEIVFAAPPNVRPAEGSALQKTVSRIVARSHEPDGVQIRSRSERPQVATGSVLTFFHLEKKVVLEGSRAVKPRFAQGDDWIEAEKIHVFHQAERAVWFENDVSARMKNASALRSVIEKSEASRRGSPPAPAEAAPAASKRSGAAGEAPLDVKASFLAVRFPSEDDRSGAEVRDVIATGTREQPLVVTSEGERWFRLSGRELYWDHVEEVAQLVGFAPLDLADLSATPAEDLARILIEGGELGAQKIRFDRRTWKAHLSDLVRIRSKRTHPETGKPMVELTAGATEVEFFPELKAPDGGRKEEGLAADLGSVRTMSSRQPALAPLAATGYFNDGIPFTASAQEASWTHESRELRFHGTGEQEIRLLAASVQGPIRAREIVFHERKAMVALRGEVHGDLVQRQAPSEPPPRPAAGASPASPAPPTGGRPIHWKLATNALELDLNRGPGRKSSPVTSIRARDKVDLRSEDLGVQLRGDDLVFDHDTMKVRIFSPDGRPQTMVCDAARAGAAIPNAGTEAGRGPAPGLDAATEKLHKIVSQEITLLLHRNPHALAQRGEATDWLLAEFDRDVIATFHIPEREKESRKVKGAGDTLKMVAEKLVLYVDPTQSPQAHDALASRKLVPWAVANGKVVFTSGNLQATADRAEYQEESSRVTLYGSPARLSRDNQPVFAEPVISVWQEDGSYGARYSKGETKPATLPFPSR